MGKYQIAPVLSLTALPKSPCHYGRQSEAKKPPLHRPQTKYDGTFVTVVVPLEDKSKNRAIATWIYGDEVLANLIEQAHEITTKKYGPSL